MGAIYLIRHGQASFGEADYDRLSPLGAEQGQAVGAELERRSVRFTEAWCGSLSRQRKTAETVLDRLGFVLPVREDPRWNEYENIDIVAHHGDTAPSVADPPTAAAETDFSQQSGSGPHSPSSDRIGNVRQADTGKRGGQSVFDRALTAWIEAGGETPCAESWPAFRDRVRDALADVVAALGKGENAVVFTSGGVIGTIAGHLLGNPELGLLKMHQVVTNGSITKLVSGRRGVTLLTFNEHAHFDGGDPRLSTYR